MARAAAGRTIRRPDRYVHLGGFDPARKISTIVARMVTGTDSIDDLDVLRHGGMAALFGASRSFLVELARVKPLLATLHRHPRSAQEKPDIPCPAARPRPPNRWRTLQGLIDFALVHSYLDTATKWGIDKLNALRQLFTTGAWLPPALTPAE
jgi:transposase